MAKLKVVQDKYGFLSNKWFPSKKCTIAKGKTYPKCGKCEYFAIASKSKPQSSTLNWLQNKGSFNEEYYFTINSPLAEATFAFTNALPKEFLIDSGSSVNIINYDAFKKLESLISMTLEKSFFRIYPYDCKTPLPIFRKCVVESCLKCTDKRAFARFHVIDTATLCILGKSRSKLLWF